MTKPIPTVVKLPTERDIIKRMHKYNVDMTTLAKKGVSDMHTNNMEGLLQNFSLLMAGDYGDQEKIEVPIEIIRNMALFAGVTLSRLIWERYKLEKSLGRPAVEGSPESPKVVEFGLTDDDSSGTLEESEDLPDEQESPPGE